MAERILVGAFAAIAAMITASGASGATMGCAAHWTVVLDEGSFDTYGERKQEFTRAQLAAFRAKIEPAIKGAIAEACNRGTVKPRQAAGVQRVRVAAVSSAATPYFLTEGPRTLMLAGAFDQTDLGILTRGQIMAGLVCWTDPTGRGCIGLGDENPTLRRPTPLARAAEAGCASHWKITLDRESFATNGAGRTFTTAQLAAFRTKVDAVLKGTIGEVCKRGKVPARLAKDVQTVTVTSASGATEPILFPVGRHGLDLQWVFAESDLDVPRRKDIVHGLACWISPKGRQCEELQQD